VELVFDAPSCHVFGADGARVEPADAPHADPRARIPLYVGTGTPAT
jgi:hypothetical protein